MLSAGVARTCLTPYSGVELTGWGYYIERRWQTVADDLHATALVVDDGSRQVALITLDLMVIDATFTQYKGVAREFKSISPRPTDRPIGRVFEKTSPLELS